MTPNSMLYGCIKGFSCAVLVFSLLQIPALAVQTGGAGAGIKENIVGGPGAGRIEETSGGPGIAKETNKELFSWAAPAEPSKPSEILISADNVVADDFNPQITDKKDISIYVVTNVRISKAGKLQKKIRTIAIVGGFISSISSESDWVDEK